MTTFGYGRSVASGMLIAMLLLCLALALPAAAQAGDDDIPGIVMTVGQTLSGVVDDATDQTDVYSIQLTSGEQVKISVVGGGCSAQLIAPGATTLKGSWSGLGNANGSGSPLVYTPAKDGVYFLKVGANWERHGVEYTLSAFRTDKPAIVAPDSDDIFGIPIGIGSVSGVVDDVTDQVDAYAVSLFAQEQVQISVVGGGCSAQLIAPGATTLKGSWTGLGIANGGGSPLVYTPAKDGVYFLKLGANWEQHGVVYTLTLSGSAEKPPYPSFLRLRSSTASVRRGGAVSLSATLVTSTGELIGDRSVKLERSSNGQTWKTLQSLSSSTGRYAASVKVTARTWFRMTYGGDADHSACVSRKLVIQVR
jgi:hypothetical protein